MGTFPSKYSYTWEKEILDIQCYGLMGKSYSLYAPDVYGAFAPVVMSKLLLDDFSSSMMVALDVEVGLPSRGV
jgi:hypothetical protein